MSLYGALYSGVSGLAANSRSLGVISENIANANSLAEAPGGDPYRRKLVSFKEVLDKSMGANTVAVNKVEFDQSDFGKRYDPTHPAADKDGYVSTPNVNSLIEMMDMREAQRSYSANLDMIDSSKRMIERTIDRSELYIADEVLMTGTAAHVSAVIEVDRRPIGDGEPGDVTRRLQKLYFQAITGRLRKYAQWCTPVPMRQPVG